MVDRIRLYVLSDADVAREGFPDWTPDQFIEFFCATHKGCQRDTVITRIEWRYLDATDADR
jgi:hypothetical protein